MKRNILTLISILLSLHCYSQQTSDYKSIDRENPITFGGDFITFKGDTITLGSHAFFVDGQFSDEEAERYPYVFNSVNKAAEHLSDGTEESPMVLYLAPYVYWIDDPDDPAVRLPKGGSAPYGLIIECEWLKFFGLSDVAENVVLACNRGQTIGSRGNFTLFKFIGQGTSSENLTFGNYCNIDLVFPLRPELNREKRASAIVQAQLIHCNGDKIVARNTRFVSRLNLCPFVGGKRVLFDRCHFESTDDALCGTGVYLNCTLDFYSSKPFYWTRGTGAVFLNCDIRSFTSQKQYFTKANGQLAVIDTRFISETTNYIGWRDILPFETRNYQSDVSFNGKPLLISKNDPESTVDMAHKSVLNAYRFDYNGKTVYNTYNLLCGNDDWDPMGIKNKVLEAEKKNGQKYTMLPTQLLIGPSDVSIETGKDTIQLISTINRFGNYEMGDEVISWSLAPDQASLVRLDVSEDGKTCKVVPTNINDDICQVIVTASTSSGLEAASLLNVAPSKLDAPEFSLHPGVSISDSGILSVKYKLDTRFEDQSLVSWYRCSDAKGINPVEVAVSRQNKPMTEYKLCSGDIGHYMMVAVAPKHKRSDAGKTVVVVTDQSISPEDVKSDGRIFYTDFNNVSTKDQAKVLPGFWLFDSFDPLITGRIRPVNKEKDAWYYGTGRSGAANLDGLLQSQNARMFYTPVGEEFGDMKMTISVAPFKTAGQGFSIAPLYMDVVVKFDATTMSGYGLRFIRTTKFHDAVDCVIVAYKNGNVTEISDPVSTSCYRTTCFITLEIRGKRLIARATSSDKRDADPEKPEVLPEVRLEANIDSNSSGGFGIQYAGGEPTLIREVKVDWK